MRPGAGGAYQLFDKPKAGPDDGAPSDSLADVNGNYGRQRTAKPRLSWTTEPGRKPEYVRCTRGTVAATAADRPSHSLAVAEIRP